MLVVTTIPATFEAFLVPYARAASERGWIVDLATGPGAIKPDNRAVVTQVHEVPWSRKLSDPRNIFSAVRSFRRVIKATRYDLIHVHTPIAATAARAAIATIPRARRPKVVYTAHGFHFGVGAIRTRDLPIIAAEWLAGRVTDQLIVINRTDERNARRLRLVPDARLVRVDGIGLDLDWYDRADQIHEAAEVRTSLGLADEPLFTIVASLHPGKGHADALHALAAMQRTDTHLALAGDGILEHDIRDLTRELALTDRVHFMGQLPDVRPLVVASRATVLPSRREGMSRATLESLALGTPVVGYDIRGIADSVQPDGGILVPSGDIGALTRALDEAARQPLLDERGRAAVRTRLRPYAIDALIVANNNVYDRLLAPRSRGRIKGISAPVPSA